MVLVLKCNAQKYADDIANADLNVVELVVYDAVQGFQQKVECQRVAWRPSLQEKELLKFVKELI